MLKMSKKLTIKKIKKMNFQNKKNKFFEFLDKDCFLDLDQKNFLWSGNEDQLLAVIKSIPYCDSSDHLVSFIYFWNNNFLLADQETLRFFEDLKTISYNSLTVSALFCYLKVKYKQNNMSLDYTAWAQVVPILLNSKVSDAVLEFLIEMNILCEAKLRILLAKPYFLKITKSEKEFKRAVSLHFYSVPVPSNFLWDLRGFYNLLKFLKVDEKSINAVLEKTMNKKSFLDIQDFLSNYNLNF